MIVKANNKGSEIGFVFPGARLAFAKFKKAFNITLILHYFDSEYHIWIEFNILGYIIIVIFSPLTSDNLGQ